MTRVVAPHWTRYLPEAGNEMNGYADRIEALQVEIAVLQEQLRAEERAATRASKECWNANERAEARAMAIEVMDELTAS